jgi:hypothetical protein
MAKLTAVLVTIIGLWLLLAEAGVIPASLLAYQGWIIAVLVTVIGVTKLMRNFGKKRK